MVRLHVSLGALPVMAVGLREGRTTLGRDPSNDVVLPLPEVALHHAEILHARVGTRIVASPGEEIVVDGHPVMSAALTPGVRVRCGAYQLRLVAAGDTATWGRTDHGTCPAMPGARDHALPVCAARVVGGPDRGLWVAFGRGSLIVGRGPDAGLALRDPAVSWHHVALEPHAGGIRVRDLGSRNGTFVDGRRIESIVAEPGARIVLGATTLELLDQEPVAAPERDAAASAGGFVELVGESAVMQGLYAQLREAAAVPFPVLLTGETGAGKELAARALHATGPRRGRPFVPLNCAAIPKDLLEDELFGHARGAFTGATSDRAGAFVRADGGTLFLDEIAELAPELQPKLLRVLETGEVPMLGGGSRRCDVRLVSATNRDLAAETTSGRFRADLYFRLAALAIRVPPLRERLEDLGPLVRAFLAATARELGGPAAHAAGSLCGFTEEALGALASHDWPGNVRELRHLVQRAVLASHGGRVDRSLVMRLLAEMRLPAGTGAHSLDAIERDAIANALRDCQGQRRAAARRLGIGESTLYAKIRRYGLEAPSPRRRAV